MKQLLLFACLSLFTLGLNAQVFVDIDAADGGDGTSWATAYNDLNVALLTADAGSEVWIAEGLYVTPDSVSFFIDKEMTVLGGFGGDETAADQADPGKFLVTLSGDVMQNDPVGSYDSTLYLDNNRVLFVTDTNDVSAYTVTLDGFTISNGGIAVDFETGNLLPFAGAGLTTFAKTAASRLVFKANRASFGSAIASLFATANGSTYDNISLDGNFSSTQRQIYVRLLEDISFTNSDFKMLGDVSQTSGIFQFQDVNDILIEDCDFSEITTVFSGSGVRGFDIDDLLVKNCHFDSIVGGSGTGVFVFEVNGIAADRERNLDDIIIDSCMFVNNTTAGGGRGAGWRVDDLNMTIRNTTFENCTAPDGIGGASYFQMGVPDTQFDFLMENSTIKGSFDNGFGGAILVLTFSQSGVNATFDNVLFEGNDSRGNGNGGAITFANGFDGVATSDSPNKLTLKNTDFIDNGSSTSTVQGGALVFYAGDQAEGVFLDSCLFSGNSVTSQSGLLSGGGAIYMLGGVTAQTPFEISNSTFSANSTIDGTSGGAIYLVRGFDLEIENSTFLNNSTTGEGGAMAILIRESSRDTLADESVVVSYPPFSASTSSSSFFSNQAASQGGAISTQRAVMDIDNSVFANNQIVDAEGGSGGAIIFNGSGYATDALSAIITSGQLSLSANLVHNTFLDNEKSVNAAAVGDHVAFYQPGQDVIESDVNEMTIQLVNNAFVSTFDGDDRGFLVDVEPDDGVVNDVVVVGAIPIGDLTITSVGGNFYDEENLDTDLIMLADTDISDLDVVDDPDAGAGQADLPAIFVDAFGLDTDDGNPNLALFVPMDLADNPLISGAIISDLAPDQGIVGNPRGDAPDIGAFETPWDLTDVAEPIEEAGLKMTFFPNPTVNEVMIRNNEPTITNFSVIVADQTGRILQGARFNGTTNRMDFTSLPAGVYNLQLTANGKVYSKQIVKQ